MKMHQYSAILIFLQHLSFALVATQYPPTNTTTSSSAAKPGCVTKCGNVTFPYPFGFGINSTCSFNSSFDITCDSSTPNLMLPSGNQEIIEITADHVRIKNQVAAKCYGNITRQNDITVDLTSTTFSFSSSMIILVGCDDILSITTDRNLSFYCSSDSSSVSDGSCAGIGCCNTPLPRKLKGFSAELNSMYNHTLIHGFDQCGYRFVGDRNSYQFISSQLKDPDFQNRTIQNVPLVLDWAIGHGTCDRAKKMGPQFVFNSLHM